MGEVRVAVGWGVRPGEVRERVRWVGMVATAVTAAVVVVEVGGGDHATQLGQTCCGVVAMVDVTWVVWAVAPEGTEYEVVSAEALVADTVALVAGVVRVCMARPATAVEEATAPA